MSVPAYATRPRVAVIYHMFPHYRAPILRALAASDRYAFDFFGSHEPVEGIDAFTGDAQVTVTPIGFRPAGAGGVMSGLWGPVFDRRHDALILIGNPHFLQTWIAAVIGRLTGKRILFWTHGWLRREPAPKAFVRRLYFGLADRVLVYADRARDLARQAGFPVARVAPIYNSLDWDLASAHYAGLKDQDIGALRRTLGLRPDRPVLICTARLTPACRFDLLLDAAAALADRDRPVQIVLVGDGPMREQLEAQARSLKLDARFTGALYDETELSRLLYAADATVSPGKVGLTAIHSLSYGTPVVTHGDLDAQMPEVEAVTEGRTGAFFAPGDVNELALAIERVLAFPAPRDQVRADCQAVVATRYNPASQRALIEAALDDVLQRAG